MGEKIWQDGLMFNFRFCRIATMKTFDIAKNIRLLRVQSGVTQAELGERIGMAQGQIQKIETGGQSIKIDVLQKIASALCIDLSELIFKSHPFPYRHVPIKGIVNAGEPMFVFDDATDYETVAFDTERGDFFALKVRGDSMNLVAPDGAIIIVDPKQTDPEKLHKQPVVAFQDGEVIFKTWDNKGKAFQANSTQQQNYDLIPAKYGMIIMGKVVAFVVRC
jgi:repressor LexA